MPTTDASIPRTSPRRCRSIPPTTSWSSPPWRRSADRDAGQCTGSGCDLRSCARVRELRCRAATAVFDGAGLTPQFPGRPRARRPFPRLVLRGHPMTNPPQPPANGNPGDPFGQQPPEYGNSGDPYAQQFGSPNAAPQFGSPNGAPQFGSPSEAPQFGAAPDAPQFGAAPGAPAPAPKKKRGWIIAAGCGCLALLALLIGGCSLLVFSSSNDDDTTGSETSVEETTEEEAAEEETTEEEVAEEETTEAEATEEEATEEETSEAAAEGEGNTEVEDAVES